MARLIDTERARVDCALTVAKMCGLAQITRAQFYRHRRKALSVQGDSQLHEAVKAAALEMPSYGYRRVTAHLRRGGRCINGKTVLRSMQQQNLLCKRRRRFVRTTDSQHAHHIYPNMAREMKVTAINQLWIADITYVRMARGFLYLAAILDAYSRRVIGWAISRSLAAEVALAALQMALATRKVSDCLVHHSDRGVQYASGDYTGLLLERGLNISMSRRGNPYDNARCERFMRTLKEEEVYLSEYETLNEARSSIAHFIEAVYNKKRLHFSLGYVPPAEFEQQLCQSTSA
jgi:transposase InsO family protein